MIQKRRISSESFIKGVLYTMDANGLREASEKDQSTPNLPMLMLDEKLTPEIIKNTGLKFNVVLPSKGKKGETIWTPVESDGNGHGDVTVGFDNPAHYYNNANIKLKNSFAAVGRGLTDGTVNAANAAPNANSNTNAKANEDTKTLHRRKKKKQ